MIVGSVAFRNSSAAVSAPGVSGGALRAGRAFGARRLDDRVEQLRRRARASSAASFANALAVERRPAAQQRARGGSPACRCRGPRRRCAAASPKLEPASSISHTLVTGGSAARLGLAAARRLVAAGVEVSVWPAFRGRRARRRARASRPRCALASVARLRGGVASDVAGGAAARRRCARAALARAPSERRQQGQQLG